MYMKLRDTYMCVYEHECRPPLCILVLDDALKFVYLLFGGLLRPRHGLFGLFLHFSLNLVDEINEHSQHAKASEKAGRYV